MEEVILEVKMTKDPSPRHNDSKNQSYGSWFDNGGECVGVVNPKSFVEPFGDNTGLVSINGIVWFFSFSLRTHLQPMM
jgi:hypothetical protein